MKAPISKQTVPSFKLTGQAMLHSYLELFLPCMRPKDDIGALGPTTDALRSLCK